MKKLELMDELQHHARKMYISDLRNLDDVERLALRKYLRYRTNQDSYPLNEWNAVLKYLYEDGPYDSSVEARKRLIELLSQS